MCVVQKVPAIVIAIVIVDVVVVVIVIVGTRAVPFAFCTAAL